ncbi:MAG TPA: sugar phosphate isomerase/epimerase family protein [Gaiellales bacterium]
MTPATVEQNPDRLCLLSSALRQTPANVVAERAAEAGFGSIEWGIGPAEASNGTPAEAESLRELSAAHGLSIAGVCVQGGPASLEEPSTIRPVATFAAELGAPFLRVWAPAYRGGSIASELDRARGLVSRAIEITDMLGVVLLVENAPDSLAPSTTLARELLEGQDPGAVGVLFDPANGLIEGRLDARLAIADLGPYLHHVHVKNIAWTREDETWSWRYAALAEGMLDWPDTLAALGASGYEGLLSFDHLVCEPTVAGLRESADALRALVAETSPPAPTGSPR